MKKRDLRKRRKKKRSKDIAEFDRAVARVRLKRTPMQKKKQKAPDGE